MWPSSDSSPSVAPALDSPGRSRSLSGASPAGGSASALPNGFRPLPPYAHLFATKPHRAAVATARSQTLHQPPPAVRTHPRRHRCGSRCPGSPACEAAAPRGACCRAPASATGPVWLETSPRDVDLDGESACGLLDCGAVRPEPPVHTRQR